MSPLVFSSSLLTAGVDNACGVASLWDDTSPGIVSAPWSPLEHEFVGGVGIDESVRRGGGEREVGSVTVEECRFEEAEAADQGGGRQRGDSEGGVHGGTEREADRQVEGGRDGWREREVEGVREGGGEGRREEGREGGREGGREDDAERQDTVNGPRTCSNSVVPLITRGGTGEDEGGAEKWGGGGVGEGVGGVEEGAKTEERAGGVGGRGEGRAEERRAGAEERGVGGQRDKVTDTEEASVAGIAIVSRQCGTGTLKS